MPLENITSIQIHKLQSETYKRPGTTTKQIQFSTSLIKLIFCLDRLSTQLFLSHRTSRKELYLTDTILGSKVSGIADTDQKVTTRKHSPRNGVNFLDNSQHHLIVSGKLLIFIHLQNPNTFSELDCLRYFDQTTTYGSDGRAMLRLLINRS